LIVKLFSANLFIRGFLGDVIVISLIYFFIKIFYDFHPLKLAIFTLLFAFAVEFLQYLKLINILGLEHNIIARIVLGAVFDPCDLFAYTIGAIIVYTLDVRLVMGIILNSNKD
jgi:hypothetical protein